ncbi:hypothetical protein RB595_005771 [Gaeumannomyces hyphopodioides]
MASGFEILGLIGNTINIIETTIAVYDAIKNLRELPGAFQEVNNRLPLVKLALENAKGRATNAKPGNEATALKKLVASCEKKAKKLHDIFMEIAQKSTSREFVVAAYRSIVLKLGKKARVETLMDDILKDLGVMATHDVFQAAMKERIAEVDKARQELAEVPPSLPDSDLEDKAGAASQIGDNNRQYNNFGEGTQKNVDGNVYEAQGNMSFGMGHGQ